MYDMDMRQYDPAIARWVVQDPVIHHNFSPYSAFDNNPVFWADPSGADATRGGFGENDFSRRMDSKSNFDDSFGMFSNGGETDPKKKKNVSDSSGLPSLPPGGINPVNSQLTPVSQMESAGLVSLEGAGLNSQANNSVAVAQVFGGAMSSMMLDASSKFLDKSFYFMGSSNYSNLIDFNSQTPLFNVGVNAYESGYKQTMAQIKNLRAGLNIFSKFLGYSGYVDGVLKLSNGNFLSGSHSLGNNLASIEIGAALGWGYGLVYTGSYAVFENNLPKSEVYNRVIFGKSSATYKSRGMQNGWYKPVFYDPNFLNFNP